MNNVQFTIKLLLILSFYILHSTFYIAPAFAQGFDIGYSKLDPTNPFYFLKTVREDIELKLALTPNVKHLRYLEFATRRLKEARTMVGKNPSLIPASLERHNAYLGKLLDRRTIGGDMAQRIESSLISHLRALIKMHEDLSDKEAKRSVRSAIDKILRMPYTLPSSSRLSACNLLKKEASSSALNQVEQKVSLERAQKCSESLGS